ncbi:MAG: SDR family oxidoreductase [Desulfobacterales bacterium]
MKNFDNKRVFITGGSSGIGFSTATLLAQKGSHVILFARGEDRLETAKNELSKNAISRNQRFSCMKLDVSNHKDVEMVMAKAVKVFGAPDVLINCAGRAYPDYFETISFEQFDETMKTNLYSIWNTVSVLLPHMRKKGGHIGNISSIAGLIGVFGFTDYCASKFAIIGFSEALKSELKPYGISVSVLCPPDTATPGFEVENRTKPEETKAISASAGLMHPDKVAEAFLNGIRKGKFLIIPGLDGKLTHIAKRFFPGLVDSVMDRAIKKAGKRKNKKTAP